MAFMRVISGNPDLSYVLAKNPHSGMQARSIRRGTVYGWYPTPDSYCLNFIDSETETSFGPEQEQEFEYINVTRYASPMAYLSMISEMLTTAFRKPNEKDVPALAAVEFETVYLSDLMLLDAYRKAYPQIVFMTEDVAKDIKSLSLTVHPSYSVTMRELLNISLTMMMGMAFRSESDYVETSKEIAAKYIECMNVVDAPYVVRRLMKNALFQDRQSFALLKPQLDQSRRHTLDLVYGNNQIARRDAIKSVLQMEGRHVIDLGCGDGFYTDTIARHATAYYGVDTAEETLNVAKNKYGKIEKAKFFGSLPVAVAELPDGVPVTVLMTEVIEHMPLETAADLVIDAAATPGLEQMVITTPNQDFNHLYGMADGEVRHEDHDWEMGADAFRQWLTGLLPHMEISFSQIGDGVDGIRPQLMAVVQKKGE